MIWIIYSQKNDFTWESSSVEFNCSFRFSKQRLQQFPMLLILACCHFLQSKVYWQFWRYKYTENIISIVFYMTVSLYMLISSFGWPMIYLRRVGCSNVHFYLLYQLQCQQEKDTNLLSLALTQNIIPKFLVYFIKS